VRQEVTANGAMPAAQERRAAGSGMRDVVTGQKSCEEDETDGENEAGTRRGWVVQGERGGGKLWSTSAAGGTSTAATESDSVL
jgi:hypothetical protein